MACVKVLQYPIVDHTFLRLVSLFEAKVLRDAISVRKVAGVAPYVLLYTFVAKNTAFERASLVRTPKEAGRRRIHSSIGIHFIAVDHAALSTAITTVVVANSIVVHQVALSISSPCIDTSLLLKLNFVPANDVRTNLAVVILVINVRGRRNLVVWKNF